MRTYINIVLAVVVGAGLAFGAGREIRVERAEEQGRVLVEARPVFEALGAKVEWDEQAQRVDVTRKDTQITLYINNTYARVDCQDIEMDVPARIIKGTTCIPLRFVAETLGCAVEYSGASVRLKPREGEAVAVRFKGG